MKKEIPITAAKVSHPTKAAIVKEGSVDISDSDDNVEIVDDTKPIVGVKRPAETKSADSFIEETNTQAKRARGSE